MTASPPSAAAVRVAVLGCGNVGASLVETLLARRDEIAARTGVALELVGIAVQDLDRRRSPAIPTDLLTDDAKELVHRDGVVRWFYRDESIRLRPHPREALAAIRKSVSIPLTK